MLAMHYRIALPDQEAVTAVRQRIAERGPLFDDMTGLAHKFFLLDPADPTYATFYLWQNEEAAQRFLDGAFFAALAETFGRPHVHLLLPRTIVLPPDDATEVWLSESDSTSPTRIDALDPATGHMLSLSFTPDASARRFELGYHARGTAALDRNRASDAISFVSL